MKNNGNERLEKMFKLLIESQFNLENEWVSLTCIWFWCVWEEFTFNWCKIAWCGWSR